MSYAFLGGIDQQFRRIIRVFPKRTNQAITEGAMVKFNYTDYVIELAPDNATGADLGIAVETVAATVPMISVLVEGAGIVETTTTLKFNERVKVTTNQRIGKWDATADAAAPEKKAGNFIRVASKINQGFGPNPVTDAAATNKVIIWLYRTI